MSNRDIQPSKPQDAPSRFRSDPKCRIYVFAKNLDPKDLQDHFSKFGSILDLTARPGGGAFIGKK